MSDDDCGGGSGGVGGEGGVSKREESVCLNLNGLVAEGVADSLYSRLCILLRVGMSRGLSFRI